MLSHGDDQSGRRLFDVDRVVEVEPVGKGHLVEQQVLRGEVALFGQCVPFGIVRVHVLVEPFERIGNREDVLDVGLLPRPVGKGVDVREVVRVRDSAFFTGAKRELHRVDAREVFAREVGVRPEREAFVEVLHKLVVELVPGDHHTQESDRDDAKPKEGLSSGDDELSEVDDRRPTFRGWRLTLADGENRHQGRQHEEGVEKRCRHADRRDVPEIVEGANVAQS